MNETTKQPLPELDDRLMSALSFVRQGGVMCDVGTDHAYLPIYALLTGRCTRAVASDINKGPLLRGEENARRWGVADRLLCLLSDGLAGVEPEKNGVTDIVICGMGGELMARIVDESPYTRRAGVRLILQPMSMAGELRRYLLSHGFDIVDEALSRAGGKVYACISAEYGGERDQSPQYSETELLLGRHNIRRSGALLRELGEKELVKLRKRIDGLRTGGHDCAAEERLVEQLEAVLA